MSFTLKPLEWISSSRDDLREFPEDVQQSIGFALYRAQLGSKHPEFQKKSKRGISTPKQDIELIESRLKRAREDYESYLKRKEQEDLK